VEPAFSYPTQAAILFVIKSIDQPAWIEPGKLRAQDGARLPLGFEGEYPCGV
jgi:hypothetical protein